MENRIYKLEQELGYTFKNKDLIKVALTHSSKSNENKHLENNERLEFLGDAVLDLCVGAYLYKTLPKDKEGVLTKIKTWRIHSSWQRRNDKRREIQEKYNR